MWPRTDLMELLGVDCPIIQAPMAGAATPALAAAVCNAGGLGSLGCATDSPDELRARVDELRGATNRPFNLNFFVHEPPAPKPEAEDETRARLAPFYDELGLGEVPAAREPFPAFDGERLAALLELRPAVASFHFGLPAPAAVRALKEAGVLILSSATTVAEAKALAEAGADAVVAQGWEAGGHRGTFASPFEGARVGTLALVPQVADAVEVPVIAAGGIADGRGIAAAFALGASGVQLGTAFLSCPEAQVTVPHRAALRAARDEDTRLTRAFSGRPARGLRNRYVEAMAPFDDALPSFPRLSSLTGPLGRASAARGSPDFIPLWSGQAVALNRELPAADLVQVLVDETAAVLASTSG
jgi:nitronate monooxygenase